MKTNDSDDIRRIESRRQILVDGPDCKCGEIHGFTWEGLYERGLSLATLDALDEWMEGQTMTACDNCGPIVYECDFRRFAGGYERSWGDR